MKGSLYPRATPTISDDLLGVQATGPNTRRMLIQDLITLFLNNIPAAEGSLPYVSSGLVWSGDAYASTRAASMTAGRIKVNTSFLAISAVTARVFTASKDTYIDVLDNLDGTGTLVYTEVTNNAASPALAANSTRIGIIVTGASNIASVASINQGQEDRVLPIASSIPYAVTDSLGNLICPRDPNTKILGMRRLNADYLWSTPDAAYSDVTGMSVPFIVPTARKVRASIIGATMKTDAGAGNVMGLGIRESTTTLGHSLFQQPVANLVTQMSNEYIGTPTAGLHTYKLSVSKQGGNGSLYSSLSPTWTVAGQLYLRIELM